MKRSRVSLAVSRIVLAGLAAAVAGCPSPRNEIAPGLSVPSGADGGRSPNTAETDGPAENRDGAASAAEACPKGQHRCGAVCVADEDVGSCGGRCNDPCPAPMGGEATCDGFRCGARCPDGQRVCMGVCRSVDEACGDCPPGKNPCNGRCVDPQDVSACGGTCQPCPTDPNGVATCTAAGCALVCNPGFHRCGDACLANDSADSCGGRCDRCPSNGGTAVCVAGECDVQCAEDKQSCDRQCIPKTQPCSDRCPDGLTKCGGQCVPDGEVPDEVCDGRDNNCNGRVDDGAPCAPMGNAKRTCEEGQCVVDMCNSGFRICSGTCISDEQPCGDSCPGGRSNCGGRCVPDSQVPPESCDGQDNNCNGRIDDGASCTAAGNASRKCQGGQCVIDRCDGGFRICNGVCVSDEQPCGNECPGGRSNCGGSCVPNSQVPKEQCNGRDDNCNGAVDEGVSCPGASGGRGVCRGSSGCDIECNDGFNKCGSSCFSRNDNNHCGSCNNACRNGSQCGNGVCGCPSGTHECPGRCASNNDPNTCGDRCTPCPGTSGGTATCSQGRCGIKCSGGLRPCSDGTCKECCSADDCSAQRGDGGTVQCVAGKCECGGANPVRCGASRKCYDLFYGCDECKQGFVWRSFCSLDDHVCISGARIEEYKAQESRDAQRRAETGDPATCDPPFVERRGRSCDTNCVTQSEKDAVDRENRAPKANRVVPD